MGASVARHDDTISVCQPFYGVGVYKRGEIRDVDWPGRCFRKKNGDIEWEEIQGAGKKHPMIGLSEIQVNDDFTLFPEPNSEFGQGGAQVAVNSCEQDSNSLNNDNCFFRTTSLTRFSADVFNTTSRREWDKIFESYNNIEKDCKQSASDKQCTINDKMKKKAYIRISLKCMQHALPKQLWDLDGALVLLSRAYSRCEKCYCITKFPIESLESRFETKFPVRS